MRSSVSYTRRKGGELKVSRGRGGDLRPYIRKLKITTKISSFTHVAIRRDVAIILMLSKDSHNTIIDGEERPQCVIRNKDLSIDSIKSAKLMQLFRIFILSTRTNTFCMSWDTLIKTGWIQQGCFKRNPRGF